MTRDEIDKAVKEIREHCRNNNCRTCEAFTNQGCVFMSSYPNAWFTIVEAEDAGSEDKIWQEKKQ